jgi:hypothetical protein
MLGVSCGKHIERRAIFYLPGQIRSGAEAEDHTDSRLAGKPWADFRERVGQIRGGCYD